MTEDNELKGEGNSLDFGARFYDPRVGRFLSLDPMMEKYPNISPYAAFANNPVMFVDPDGRDYMVLVNHETNTIQICATFNVENIGDPTLATSMLTRIIEKFNGNTRKYVIGDKEYTVSFNISSYNEETYSFSKNGPINSVVVTSSSYNEAKSTMSMLKSKYHINLDDNAMGAGVRSSTFVNQYQVHAYNRGENDSYGKTLLHELGHCLGMMHCGFGFMYFLEGNVASTFNFQDENFLDPLGRAGIGPMKNLTITDLAPDIENNNPLFMGQPLIYKNQRQMYFGETCNGKIFYPGTFDYFNLLKDSYSVSKPEESSRKNYVEIGTAPSDFENGVIR